jgi:protein TonB
MNRLYNTEKQYRKYRVAAVITGVAIHLLVVIGLFFYRDEVIGPNETKPDEIAFGSSGGGGEENSNKNEPVEFGEHQATQDPSERVYKKAEIQLITIQIEQPPPPIVENAQPVPEKEKPKAVAVRKTKPRKTIIAENLPIGHVRHGGQGPGSGGGMGGGSGGGIGARYGSSIDWGGEGGRRLLSGRIPVYPEGYTDKQMVVLLQFSVFPDGSVGQVTPVRKTDEYLERAAVAALKTWRFESLPLQVDQKVQVGKVPFSFKLEQFTKGRQE